MLVNACGIPVRTQESRSPYSGDLRSLLNVFRESLGGFNRLLVLTVFRLQPSSGSNRLLARLLEAPTVFSNTLEVFRAF